MTAKPQRYSARERVAAQKNSFASTSVDTGAYEAFSFTRAEVLLLDILQFRAGVGNPYTAQGLPTYERTYFVHRNLGASGMDSYVCPAKYGEAIGKKLPCPVCEYVAQQRKNPEADQKVVGDMRPKERQLFLVRDPSWDAGESKVLDISYHLFGRLLNTVVKNLDPNDDDESDYEYFADLASGYTLKIGVTDKANPFGGKPFQEATTINFKRRKVQYSPDLLDTNPCLDDMILVPTYEQLKTVFEEEPNVSDDEHDAPPADTRQRSSTRPTHDHDEDDEAPVTKPPKTETSKPKTTTKSEQLGKRLENAAKAEKAEAPEYKVAADYGIVKGMDVVYGGKPCTVTKVSPDGTSLTLIDEDEDVIKGVSVDDILESITADKPKETVQATKATKADKAAKTTKVQAPVQEPATVAVDNPEAGDGSDWDNWD